MTLVEHAELLAWRAHSGQTRRDGSPYINHVRRVAESLKDHSDETIATAWLHDVLEDTRDAYGITPYTSEIRNRCGESVLLECEALDKALCGGTYKDYIAHIQARPVARLVKIADILDNLFDDPSDSAKERYKEALKTLCL